MLKLLKKITLLLIVIFIALPLIAEVGSVGDLNEIGMGARVLGMGKAFVGIADDSNSIFSNPAGLGSIHKMEVMSMKASLQGDIDYLVLGGSLPLEIGTVGVGYIASTVDDIVLVSALNANGRPVAGNSISYKEQEVYVGYGMDILQSIRGLLDLDGALYLGANLKLFLKEASGITDGQGTGLGADIGLLYAPTDQFSIGISQQNLSSQISWQSGAKDDVQGLTKIGMKLNADKVLLGLDADIAGSDQPVLLHGGVEWQVIPYLSVRGGVDQILEPQVSGSANKAGVASNMTLGVGLQLMGVKLDYAYHPFYDEEDNLTHFVSLSYSK
ncbi:hypothetical protein ACFL4D_02405 [Candidatus Margulisiibacteriota bacterium]